MTTALRYDENGVATAVIMPPGDAPRHPAPMAAGRDPAAGYAAAALAHYMQGRHDIALIQCEIALAQSPTDRTALNVAAAAAAAVASRDRTLAAFERAASCGHRAVAAMGVPASPEDAFVVVQYALTLVALGHLAEAHALVPLIAERWSRDATVCYGIAWLYRRCGDVAAYRAWCARGFACPHTTPSHHVQRQTAQLDLGHWDLVRDFSLVSDAAWASVAGLSTPAWTGERLPGGTLLCVRAVGYIREGYGDLMMCARFLPLVASRVARLLVDVPDPLVALYAETFRGIPNLELVNLSTVWERGAAAAWPKHDQHTGHLSLAGLFWREMSARPFLVAPAGPSIRRDGGCHVGIAWSARDRDPRPDRIAPAYRQIPLAALAPLLELPGVTVHSLQVGPAAAELDAYPAIRQHEIRTFAEAAAVCEQLDCVVTVDTAVAHLAGGLGVPTLTLISNAADFRWGLEGETTPWYGSMRLLRERAPGDCSAVAQRAIAAIAARDFPGRLFQPVE